MKKIVLLALSLMAIGQVNAQEKKSVEAFDKADNVETTSALDNFELHAGIETAHLWRGLIISDMPTVTGSISYYFDANKQWRVGLWGGTAVSADSDNTHYKEVDYFVEYNSKFFTIGLWDLYNTRNVAQSDVFNYEDDETTHLLDLRTAFYLGDSFPMRLQANFLLYGTGDKELNDDLEEEQRYSTYIEAAYPIYKRQQMDVNAFLGAGTSLSGDTHLYGDGENNFDIVNVGLTANRNMNIGQFNLPVHGTFLWNPSQEYVRFQLAADLF